MPKPRLIKSIDKIMEDDIKKLPNVPDKHIKQHKYNSDFFCANEAESDIDSVDVKCFVQCSYCKFI